MSIISTQSKAQRCRSQVSFCYLCGEALAGSGQTIREHIVPKAVLGGASSLAAWTPVLDVHQTCERDGKRPFDEVYALFQKLNLPIEAKMTRADKGMERAFEAARQYGPNGERAQAAATAKLAADLATAASSDDQASAQRAIYRFLDASGAPPKDIARAKVDVALLLDPRGTLCSGHYRKTTLKPADDVVTDGLTLPPCSFALDGFGDVMSAVWNWVRGFHALVYGAYLSRDTEHAVMTRDLPVYRGTTSPLPAFDDRFCRTILNMVDAAALANKADGVHYWDESCGFRCAWLNMPEVKSLSRCLWCIDLPIPQHPSAWCGWYDTPTPPANAKLLRQSDLDVYYNRQRNAKTT